MFAVFCFAVVASNAEFLTDSERIAIEEPEEVALRNAGENTAGMAGPRLVEGGWDYCKAVPCNSAEGDCDRSTECASGLFCGHNNCLQMTPGGTYHPLVDCCDTLKAYHWEYCKFEQCGHGDGDCDSHAQCGRGLKCGVNNCRAMHPALANTIEAEADCCTQCSEVLAGPEESPQAVEAEYMAPLVQGPARTVTSLPPLMEEAAVYNLNPLAAGDVIKLSCCPWKEDCEFLISVYHCKPCSEELNGGLPQHLLGSGWDAGSCSPTFTTSFGPRTHAMTTYHRTLAPGEEETLPISKDAPHVIVFEMPGPLVVPWCYAKKGPFPPSETCFCIELPV